MTRHAAHSTIRRLTMLGLLIPGLAGAATTLTFLNFDDKSLSKPGWTFGAQDGGSVTVSADTSANLDGSAGSLKASYPLATGQIYAWGVYDVSALNTYEVYVDFWAKMPNAKQGLKFLKIFGGDNNGVANTTFGLDYTGVDRGSMYQVSFGDGSAAYNDTQNVINLDGSYPNWIGRSYGVATVETPMRQAFHSSDWGTGWHHFRMRVKFNSGTTAANEKPDGAYYVEIDGKVYVNATGLFNRHYSNPPINSVALLNWSQTGTAPFDIWYDNVRISTGGFVDDVPPRAPSDVIVE
ncbi:MAG: hypothetical protein U1F08_06290 [Steroidobacteraceae bacterium]